MLLKKLVIAADDESIGHLVAATLGDAGFLCLRARDGDEAMVLVRREQPDALILDIMMPKMDGIEVAQRIKGDVLLSRVPILMLTSLAGVDDRVAGFDAGADDYLPKPFDLRELVARTKALIRLNRRERDRNPVTNLPGNEAIDDKATELLAQKTAFVLLYFDIDNFRSYADVYGYRKADEVVQRIGRLLLDQCRNAADPPPFLGHLGGDDFIVIAQPELADGLIDGVTSAFAEIVDSFYGPDDRARGHLQLMDRNGGVTRQAKFMSPCATKVNVSPGQYSSTEELASQVTRSKMQSRKKGDR
jgi:DNA-binding response OmpR family regulator